MKRILAITFLNYFVSGGLTLIIPLLLLERNLDLAEIGIILSALPLVFLIVRLFLAALCDLVGWARFYLLLNWPATFFSTLIFFVANSTPAFLGGKIVQAVQEASYWAVNRTAIFVLSPQREEREATRNVAVLSLSTAIGSAMSGIGLAYIGFSSTLSILILASSIIGIPAALLWQKGRPNSRVSASRALRLLDPRGKGRTFWLVAFTMLFYSLAKYPLVTLLLPVFMAQELAYNYITIGVTYMLYNIIASCVTFGALKISLGVGRVLIQSAIALVASLLMVNSDGYFPIFFLALALAHGLGIGFFESIIAKVTKNQRTVSIDIGLLHIPMRLAEFASVLYAGFLAQSLGYLILFVFSGIFFAVFSALSVYALRA